MTTGLLKLPGEDAAVFRYANEIDKQRAIARGKSVPTAKGLHEELSGSAGRLATSAESGKTVELLTEMKQLRLLDDDAAKAETECSRLTFPEQNMKLLIALRRAQSYAGKLHRWCWFLDPQDETDREDQATRRRTAIKEIAETDEHEWLDKAAHDKAKQRHALLGEAKEEPESHPEIVKALKVELERLIEKLPCWLETIANRTYHSRRGRLVWRNHPDKPDCHLLDFSLLPKDERDLLTKEEKWLAGQRGLSIERIEQLEELRKRCQSLNQMLRRNIGHPPKATRDDSIPDPCPTILAKLDEIKEQRRNQTAHMILVEALGLTLAEPTKLATDAEHRLREAKDSHGEYMKSDDKGRPVSPEAGNKWRGVVDFIVIEDLSRYRTSQGRAPRENSRLMKWCHRAIRDKLKDANGSGMCELFGIPLVETPAAYSSRFCSRTGVAGFRASEISGNPLEESKWRWRIRKPQEGKTESEDQKKRREDWELLLQQVQAVNKNRNGKNNGQQFRTLLAPDAGGSIFIPISRLKAGYARHSKEDPIIRFEPVRLKEEENQEKQPTLIHADINAAVNLGLRTVADPRLWSIHSRLRSERKLGTPPQPKAKKGKRKSKTPGAVPATIEQIEPDTFWVSEKEKRKYGEQTDDTRIEIKLLNAEKANLKASDSRHPNFFNDVADLKTWVHNGAAILEGLPDNCRMPAHLVSSKSLWGYVKEQAWRRCMEINSARLRAWGIEPPPEWTT